MGVKKSKKGPITLIVIGSLLASGPVWGLLGTVVGMILAFRVLGQSSGATPGQLAAKISGSLSATVIGLSVSPLGVAMLAGGIIWLIRIEKSACYP